MYVADFCNNGILLCCKFSTGNNSNNGNWINISFIVCILSNCANHMIYEIYCDGACEPKNPGGVATFGYAIYLDNTLIDFDYGEICRGNGATNNVAEFWAVIKALENKNLQERENIIIYSDSKLIINTLSGRWRLHKPHLQKLFKKAKNLENRFTKVKYKWIPREKNFEADNLSRRPYL